jgi:hypothetical protein
MLSEIFNPFKLIFVVIPFVVGLYFYARCAKAENDRDKLILFGLSAFCFFFWLVYMYGFVSQLYKTFFDKY